MKRKFRVFLGAIFLSVSIGCFFYPDYYKWKMDCEINIIEKEILEPLPQKENKKKEKNYEALYKEMEIYNQRLEIQGQNLVDAWSYEEPPIPQHFIPNGDYAVGTIEIPDMQVKLPLLLGASKENLSKGAGILSETSMPIGGRNSNCVIAAHRGWRGNPYFQYIENMSEGSLVYIKNPWETRIYQAVEVKIINPWDLESILIQPEKDMVTLLTCHPYGIGGGTQRYLVYCEYVKTQSQVENVNTEKKNEDRKLNENEIQNGGQSKKFMKWEERVCIVFPMVTLIIIIFRFFYNLYLDKRNKNSYNMDTNN